MPSWFPQWHPVKWLVVAVIVYAVWKDPAGWGHWVGHMLSYIPVLVSRLTTFATSI